MNRYWTRWASVLFAMGIWGCAPQTGLGRATVQAKGHTRIGLAVVPSFETAVLLPEQPITGPWLRILAGVHHGISDKMEIGGRLWWFSLPTVGTEWGLAFDSKIALRRPPTGHGTHITIAPSLSYQQPRMPGAPWHVFGVHLPLLFGFDARRHQFVLGPRISIQGVGAYGMESIVYPGFGASFAFFGRIKRTFDISPELVLMWAPIPFGGEASADKTRIGASSLQFSLGGSWEVFEPAK
jgi:hypothetical protein